MMIGRGRFNIYLLLGLAVALLAGCRTPGDPGQVLATLRLHLQVIPSLDAFSTRVPVFRQHPVMLTVDRSPFLTEADVASAKVVNVEGGFDLQIEFNREGAWILEDYTATHQGRHIAIFSEFGSAVRKSRWLGAPVITHRISDGVLTFTPDATHQEAEEIALGLNNMAKKVKKASAW